jgi:hypothetical protein
MAATYPVWPSVTIRHWVNPGGDSSDRSSVGLPLTSNQSMLTSGNAGPTSAVASSYIGIDRCGLSRVRDLRQISHHGAKGT